MPPSYPKVEHFVYEDEKIIDNGDGTVTVPYISREIVAARSETYPIRKLGHPHVYFEKGNILIACQVSWITLSSFYTYSNGDIGEDEQLQKHRYNFVHSPELYGVGNTYTLLGKLDNEKTRAINADDVFIYKSNQTISYKSAKPNYGSVIVNFLKYDLGRVSLVFYYPLNEYKKVLKEVKKHGEHFGSKRIVNLFRQNENMI